MENLKMEHPVVLIMRHITVYTTLNISSHCNSTRHYIFWLVINLLLVASNYRNKTEQHKQETLKYCKVQASKTAPERIQQGGVCKLKHGLSIN